MNIGIDAKPLSKNKTGIGVYTEEIVRRINEQDRENTYFLYTSRDFSIDCELGDNFILRQKETKNKIASLLYFLTMHNRLKQDNIDIYWGTQYFLPRRTKYTKKVKYILTIYDLAIAKLKTVGALKTTIMHKLFLKSSIKDADKILSISEATKKDIIDIYGINKEKIDVIYLGTTTAKEQIINEAEEKEIKEKFKIENVPYLFFLSTIEPRKNIETLIKAFNYIKEKENTNLKLILAGGLGWKYGNIINLYEASKYKEDIIMPGYISKKEKKYLYEHAKSFVYPSLYEGFGLPVLEAMANKALVITTNISSLPEVGGDAAFYYDNILDYQELGEKILEVINLSEEQKQEKIEQGLNQVKKFTWDKCAQETIKVLKNEG